MFVGTRTLLEPESAVATTEYETFAGTATVMSPEPSSTLTSAGGRVKERSTSPEPSCACTLLAEMSAPLMSPEPALEYQ